MILNNKNLVHNNKSISNDFVNNKDIDLIKEIENKTNTEGLNAFQNYIIRYS